MKFAIITHVPHIVERHQYFAYAPYVREMNIWGNFVNEIVIVAPKTSKAKAEIDIAYQNSNIKFIEIEGFDLLGLSALISAVIKIPKIFIQIFVAMRSADHIHLRCPGNIGLLGCLVQIVFPTKSKTAKYAGNWDPKSNQPWSYKLQQWILNNTFLTRNMQVLVYGEWEGSSKNIKPFFTATYSEVEKTPLEIKKLNAKINFIFVGTLVAGKNPLFAIQLVENLNKLGFDVVLNLYGEGVLRRELENYIYQNNLQDFIIFKGNQNKETLKVAYQKSHFVILPSQSEGWPKALAEAMFWGCVPISSAVSCVPYMLDMGRRGVFLEMDLKKDTIALSNIINNDDAYSKMSMGSHDWSNRYTLDFFESEIKKLLQK